jgi:peroxiredoxin Q/BCP
MLLAIGSAAPPFSLPDEQEITRRLEDYRGQYVILYFYPEDDSPGCTTEACTIAEIYEEFKKAGVRVVGVSKDSPRSHRRFKEKYHLPFTLLSDEAGEMIEQYGATEEPTAFSEGENGFAVVRISYLIDPQGTVVRVYPSVDPTTHALELLKDARELNN